jgi:uncharacterized protein YjiS (DUF1127 family)
MDLLKNALRVWAMHREFRAVLAELNSYSDRELAELGVGRGDVARVAYEEAERRVATPPPQAAPKPPPGPDGTLLWCPAGERAGRAVPPWQVEVHDGHQA